MEGQALVAAVSTKQPYVGRRCGTGPDRRRRLRRETLDLPPPCRCGRGRDGRPAHLVGRRARGVRRRPPLERARRPGAIARGGRHRPRAPGSRPDPRDLPRPSAARSRDRPRDVTSSRSATAAPTTRCSSARTGRVLVTSQNHGFAVAPSESSRGDVRLALRRHRRGLRLPELRARSVQFHPEAGPGPHDAWPILEDWVEELRRPSAPARRHRVDLRHRIGADRHRPGLRVRLRRLPGAEGAPRGRLPHDRRQLEPGDDHDRPGFADRTYIEPLDLEGVAGVLAPRAPRRAAADARRADRAQPRRRALPRTGILDGARRRADQRAGRRDPARRGPRALPRGGAIVRPRGAGVDDRDRRSTELDGHARSRGRAPGVHARRPRRWLRRRSRERLASPRRARPARVARSARCSSRSRCAAGTSSSSRSCATARTTSSSSARSRTSTRWACTRATRSRSRRR